MHPLSRRLIERTPPRLRRPVALTIRTGDSAIQDRLPGLAAEIAFWVVLSLPALLLAAIASAGVLAADGEWQRQLVERIIEVARVALTEGTVQGPIRRVLEQLIEDGGPGLVSFAAVATVWTASRAVKVVLGTLAIVYGREGHRSGWQNRLLGFAVTLGGLVLGIVLAPLMIAGPGFGENIQEWAGTDLEPLPTLWRLLYWPTTIVVATLALAVLYHLGVPGGTRWRRALPGAVVATAVWLAGSGALRLYGAWIAGGDSVYGPLAGPIVVLLWLWLTGFAVLLGGELNAQIEHVWPRHGARDDAELLERGRPERRVPAEATAGEDPATERREADSEGAEHEQDTTRPIADGGQADQETTRPISGPPGPRS